MLPIPIGCPCPVMLIRQALTAHLCARCLLLSSGKSSSQTLAQFLALLQSFPWGSARSALLPLKLHELALLIYCPVAVVPMTRASVETGLHPSNLCLVHDVSVNTITQSEQMTAKSRGSNRLRSLHFETILFLSKLSVALNAS